MRLSRFYFLVTGFFLLVNIELFAQVGDPLPRSNPEAEGVSSSDILKFLDAWGKSKNEIHSLMILRHGKVIAEGWWNPYRPDLRHTMYSTSKSFTSTAIGFAVTEGKLKLSDKVLSFFPGQLPDTVDPKLSGLTVKDVITMSDGQRPDPTGGAMQSDNWAQYFLSRPIVDNPGKDFLYNSLGTYMLSAIVQKVTGEKVIDYLRPRLLAPLGIQGVDWETSPQGINSGGWGLRLKTEDMAKFGQLYLQKGVWKGKQLIPKTWVEEATTYKIDQAPNMPKASRDSNDWVQGYCYQFWRCRHNAFRADGAFGQYIIVMPDQDAVIVITSETANMQDELNLVWDYLLPAFKSTLLPNNPDVYVQVKQKLATEALPVPVVVADPSIAGAISGKNFSIEPNDWHVKQVSFLFGQQSCSLLLNQEDSTYSFTFNQGKWHYGETRRPNIPISLIRASKGPYADLGPAKFAASYTWKDDKTLELTLRYIESPHTEYLICHFENNTVSIELDGSLQRMMHRKNNVLKGSF